MANNCNQIYVVMTVSVMNTVSVDNEMLSKLERNKYHLENQWKITSHDGDILILYIVGESQITYNIMKKLCKFLNTMKIGIVTCLKTALLEHSPIRFASHICFILTTASIVYNEHENVYNKHGK